MERQVDKKCVNGRATAVGNYWRSPSGDPDVQNMPQNCPTKGQEAGVFIHQLSSWLVMVAPGMFMPLAFQSDPCGGQVQSRATGLLKRDQEAEGVGRAGSREASCTEVVGDSGEGSVGRKGQGPLRTDLWENER